MNFYRKILFNYLNNFDNLLVSIHEKIFKNDRKIAKIKKY